MQGVGNVLAMENAAGYVTFSKDGYLIRELNLFKGCYQLEV